MNSLLDDDYDETSTNDREVTLSSATILGIFLGLVLLCGLFFGFGYKMGSSRTVPVVAAPSSGASVPPIANFNNLKPAAGSPVGITPSPVHAISETRPAAVIPSEMPAAQPTVRSPTPTAAHAVAQNPPATAGTILVQVAAFTHQEDADLLVHTLKSQGYSAFVRTEPQDKLLHIQVGPFSNRKDAEATKQRLLADGYQPIVK
jgi:DedD protein